MLSSLDSVVALLAEGGDRNSSTLIVSLEPLESPSSRRAGIEMWKQTTCPNGGGVALLAEGGDRNRRTLTMKSCSMVALLAEGGDRN